MTASVITSMTAAQRSTRLLAGGSLTGDDSSPYLCQRLCTWTPASGGHVRLQDLTPGQNTHVRLVRSAVGVWMQRDLGSGLVHDRGTGPWYTIATETPCARLAGLGLLRPSHLGHRMRIGCRAKRLPLL